MTDRTPMQRALDAEAKVTDLARRVEVLEGALRPFAKAYDLHLTEHGCAAEVGGWVPMDDDYPLDGVHLVHFARARSALSTPSVGGSLAEENERLREALRSAKRLCDNIDEFGCVTDEEFYSVAERQIRAALSGKDRT